MCPKLNCHTTLVCGCITLTIILTFAAINAVIYIAPLYIPIEVAIAKFDRSQPPTHSELELHMIDVDEEWKALEPVMYEALDTSTSMSLLARASALRMIHAKDEYKSLLRDASQVVRAGAIDQLDVILMDHYAPNMTNDRYDVVRVWQAIILDHLMEYDYDLVGVEGADGENYSLDGNVRNAVASARDLGVAIDPQKIAAHLKDQLEFSAPLQFSMRLPKPRTIMIGAEDFSLNIIHGEIMELRLSEVACLAAESLRSRVIIANTILAMQRHKARRGAVIIGWKHYGELQAFAQTLGIQGRMYSVPALVK